MNENPIIVIPSRLAARRFDRKPLALINGKPMILRVWEQAMKTNIGPVIVACCSKEVKATIESAGGIAILTDPNLPSGTDRIYQALEEYDPEKKYTSVVNLQGDLPTIDPDDIKKTLKALTSQKEMDIATLACPIYSEEERHNPNIVKVVIGNLEKDMGQAFYFTREPVFSGNNKLFHHIGIYAFLRPILEEFVKSPPSPLEQQESLEQLRALESGCKFGVHLTNSHIFGIDDPQDIQKAEDFLKKINRR